MDSLGHTTSLQRLHLVEKVMLEIPVIFFLLLWPRFSRGAFLSARQRIVRVVDLAGLAMDELANSTGPGKDILTNHLPGVHAVYQGILLPTPLDISIL